MAIIIIYIYIPFTHNNNNNNKMMIMKWYRLYSPTLMSYIICPLSQRRSDEEEISLFLSVAHMLHSYLLSVTNSARRIFMSSHAHTLSRAYKMTTISLFIAHAHASSLRALALLSVSLNIFFIHLFYIFGCSLYRKREKKKWQYLLLFCAPSTSYHHTSHLLCTLHSALSPLFSLWITLLPALFFLSPLFLHLHLCHTLTRSYTLAHISPLSRNDREMKKTIWNRSGRKRKYRYMRWNSRKWNEKRRGKFARGARIAIYASHITLSYLIFSYLCARTSITPYLLSSMAKKMTMKGVIMSKKWYISCRRIYLNNVCSALSL